MQLIHPRFKRFLNHFFLQEKFTLKTFVFFFLGLLRLKFNFILGFICLSFMQLIKLRCLLSFLLYKRVAGTCVGLWKQSPSTSLPQALRKSRFTTPE